MSKKITYDLTPEESANISDSRFTIYGEHFMSFLSLSNDEAGEVLKLMIITAITNGNESKYAEKIPEKFRKSSSKVGSFWSGIYSKLLAQVQGRANGKKGGNPALISKSRNADPLNPPLQPPVTTPGYPPYYTIPNNTILSSGGGYSNTNTEQPTTKPDNQTRKAQEVFNGHVDPEEFQKYANEKGYNIVIAMDCWDRNQNEWGWKSIRSGECSDFREVLDRWMATTNPNKYKGQAFTPDPNTEHSFELDKFAEVAMKPRPWNT